MDSDEECIVLFYFIPELHFNNIISNKVFGYVSAVCYKPEVGGGVVAPVVVLPFRHKCICFSHVGPCLDAWIESVFNLILKVYLLVEFTPVF